MLHNLDWMLKLGRWILHNYAYEVHILSTMNTIILVSINNAKNNVCKWNDTIYLIKLIIKNISYLLSFKKECGSSYCASSI